MATVTARFTVNEPGLNRQFQRIGKKRLASIQRKTVVEAKMRVPVRTGNLGRTIRDDPIKVTGPRRLSGGVTAHADYAAAVHQGSRPHVIRPRNPGGVLRFNMGARVVYAKRVNHPGSKGRPFLKNAAEAVVARETATS